MNQMTLERNTKEMIKKYLNDNQRSTQNWYQMGSNGATKMESDGESDRDQMGGGHNFFFVIKNAFKTSDL